MVEEDLTEPALEPPFQTGWSKVVLPLVIFAIVLAVLAFILPKPPEKTVVAVVPTATPEPIQPVIPPSPTPNPPPVQVTPEALKKGAEPPIKVDKELELIRREHKRFTPTSLARVLEPVTKKYQSAKSRREVGWIYAEAYAYLGQRQGNKAYLAKAKQAAAVFQKEQPRDARTFRASSMVYWASGDVLRNTPAAKKAFDLSPNDPIVRFLLGASYIGTSNESEGLKVLKDTFAKYPECYPAGFALARLDVIRTRYADAESILKKLLTIEPQDAPVESLLGESLEGQGKWQEIIGRYEPMVRQYPRKANFRLLLSQAYRRTDRFGEANAHLEELVRQEEEGGLDLSRTQKAFFYQERGKLEFDQGKFQACIALFQKALDLDPQNATVLKYLGGAQFRVKRYREAARSYESAVKVDSTDVATWQYYGMALLEAGELEQAEQAFQDVLKRGSESAPVYFYLARIRQAKGDFPGAIDMAQRSVQIDPKYQSALNLLKKLKGPT